MTGVAMAVQGLECVRCCRAIPDAYVWLSDGLCNWCRTHDDEGNLR